MANNQSTQEWNQIAEEARTLIEDYDDEIGQSRAELRSIRERIDELSARVPRRDGAIVPDLNNPDYVSLVEAQRRFTTISLVITELNAERMQAEQTFSNARQQATRSLGSADGTQSVPVPVQETPDEPVAVAFPVAERNVEPFEGEVQSSLPPLANDPLPVNEVQVAIPEDSPETIVVGQSTVDQEPDTTPNDVLLYDYGTIPPVPELTPEEALERQFEEERQAALDAQGRNAQNPQTVPPTIVQPGPGTPYDDDGNLNPGWVQGPNGEVGYFPDGGAGATTAPEPNGGSNRGLQGATTSAQKKATTSATKNIPASTDWRVRLSLAPTANYLYRAANPGILAPLRATDGILFPYIPSISVSYAANYSNQDITHSNYRIFQYINSYVDNFSISCEFTAQDTFEANYILAVIHFFRSVTKMFYGQDQNPKPGTPPPLCYLHGMGAFQYNNHPLIITNFNYNLDDRVDYIRAYSNSSPPGQNQSSLNTGKSPDGLPTSQTRLGTNVKAGGEKPGPNFSTSNSSANNKDNVTYVPSKISLSISAHPVMSRDNVSNRFSFRDYASGELLRGNRGKP
jgi:hypothetical protein